MANLRGLARVYDTLDEMLDDPAVEILDIAVPPDLQRGLIEQAIARGRHLKGVLAQKAFGGELPGRRRDRTHVRRAAASAGSESEHAL